MSPGLRQAIESAVAESTGRPFRIKDSRASAGGCINDAQTVSDGERSFFLKTNHAAASGIFDAEAEALDAINATETIRAPKPVARGEADGHAFLVLEALEFGRPGPDGPAETGRRLAALHSHTADQFGWHRDNTIGSTPQSNRQHPDWAGFYRDERLTPQFALAARNGFHFAQADALLSAVPALLEAHEPAPSLLHGDLWAGNAAYLHDGTPVVFDPATYFGDRETDLAFTEYFGGFPRAFYDAYQATRPLPDGYATRRMLYNLYHVLNHANLFGGGYAGEADRMIRTLLG